MERLEGNAHNENELERRRAILEKIKDGSFFYCYTLGYLRKCLDELNLPQTAEETLVNMSASYSWHFLTKDDAMGYIKVNPDIGFSLIVIKQPMQDFDDICVNKFQIWLTLKEFSTNFTPELARLIDSVSVPYFETPDLDLKGTNSLIRKGLRKVRRNSFSESIASTQAALYDQLQTVLGNK
ncbi:hypothetical protein GF340_00830 [Candidatus Peregrinibacteria bacterium]|nr:hypothetical protein [Candidatus Peregrinibacteria bacterium]